MCGCECCIFDKNIHSSLLSWRDRYLKKLKDQSQNDQSRRYGEKTHHIYTTYKNTVMPHGRHIYAKASDMENTTMCAYPYADDALPHWKCILRCCADCPCINLPEQETNKKNEETIPSIRFHIYHIIGRCTAHGIIPLKDNTICYMRKQESLTYKYTKIYTRKELVMTETTISDFNTSFYIPANPKVGFSPTTCAHTWYKSLW